MMVAWSSNCTQNFKIPLSVFWGTQAHNFAQRWAIEWWTNSSRLTLQVCQTCQSTVKKNILSFGKPFFLLLRPQVQMTAMLQQVEHNCLLFMNNVLAQNIWWAENAWFMFLCNGKSQQSGVGPQLPSSVTFSMQFKTQFFSMIFYNYTRFLLFLQSIKPTTRAQTIPSHFAELEKLQSWPFGHQQLFSIWEKSRLYEQPLLSRSKFLNCYVRIQYKERSC